MIMAIMCDEGHFVEGQLRKCVVCGGWYCNKHFHRANHNCRTKIRKEARPTFESLRFI